MRTTGEGRGTVVGALAGGATLLLPLGLAAVAAVVFGWMDPDPAGRVRLVPWLALEVAVGGLAGLAAGRVGRRVGGDGRGASVLAGAVATLGSVEAAEILRQVGEGAAVAPAWLVVAAPLVPTATVLLGAVDRGGGGGRSPFRASRALLRRIGPYAVPAGLLAACVAVGRWGLPTVESGSKATLVASALTLDLTVVVPGLVYVLLVRTRRLPWLALLPAVVMGYLLALATLPARHHGLLEAARALVVPAEAALVVYLVYRARAALASGPTLGGDFATRFRAAARHALGARVPADILTTEVAILYHAFRLPTRGPGRTPGFTVHRESGYGAVLGALALVIAAETAAVHFLVGVWSAAAAWVLTGLGVYALVWLVGDYRALGARPLRITDTALRLRVGIRWEADVPLEALAEHQVGGRGGWAEAGGDTLVATVLGEPEVRLRFREPVEVTGLYGLRRTVSEVRLRIDDREAFGRDLAAAGVRGTS